MTVKQVCLALRRCVLANRRGFLPLRDDLSADGEAVWAALDAVEISLGAETTVEMSRDPAEILQFLEKHGCHIPAWMSVHMDNPFDWNYWLLPPGERVAAVF